jgi:hypothetical protein
MDTIHIKLTAGSIGIRLDALKGLTRRQLAHLSDVDIDLVMKVKDERFPPAKPKAPKPEPDKGD